MIFVFGLGNYPKSYANTRHNVGVDTLTQLAAFYQVKLRKRCFHLYKSAQVKTERGDICLVFPLTYMNNSGQVVPDLVKDGDEVLVLCDQIDLPPGSLKLKRNGSSAGHNGLKSMLEYLPQNFTRLYIGVGHPDENTPVPDYVLSRPSEEERVKIDKATNAAVEALINYFKGERFELIQQKSILLTLEEYLTLHTIADDATFLVAFSGGCDSLCLLSSLSLIRPGFVSACYVNHNLRNEAELEVELELNKANAKAFNVPLIIKTLEKGEVEALAKRENISIEAVAHSLRYEALNSVRKESNIDYLVTAHTKSDQSETLLMRLYTGSTLQALSGIRDRNNCVLRPLMNVSRKHTESYCEEMGLKYSNDSTNAEVVYLRNRMRHSLLPHLKELYPEFENCMFRISQNVKEIIKNDKSLPVVDKHCYVEMDIEAFFSLSLVGQSRALIQLASPYCKGRVSKGVIAALFDMCVNGEGRRDFDSFYARVRNRKLVLFPVLPTFVKVVKDNPFCFYPHFCLEKGSKSTDLSIDKSLICGKMIIRLTQEGDIICLNDKISLISDILSNQKVPYGFVLEDQKGIVALFTSIFGGRDRLAKRFLTIAPNDEFLYSVSYR